jgi:mRNA interferase MazF
MVTARFDVFLVMLDPTVGSEIQKTRPCLIIKLDHA